MESEANWNWLPMEIKAKIVAYLNIKDSLQLKRCSHAEAELVNQFATHEVTMSLKFENGPLVNMSAVHISVLDKFGETAIFFRVTECEIFTLTDVSLYNQMFMHKNQEGNRLPIVVSDIVRWILSEKVFNVKLALNNLSCDWSDPIDFKDSFRGPRSILDGFEKIYSPNDNVFHTSIFCTAAYWLKKSDFDAVMMARNYKYSEAEEHSIFDLLKRNWMNFGCLFNVTIGSFEHALKIVKSLTRGFAEIVFERDEVKNKVESPKAVDCIMYFIKTYRTRGSSSLVYLNNKPDSARKIAFLSEGLEKTNGKLDNFQLTTLIFLFRLRLVLDQPEVPEVYEKVRDGFQLVLKEYQEENYFEKLMRKLEILSEDI